MNLACHVNGRTEYITARRITAILVWLCTKIRNSILSIPSSAEMYVVVIMIS